MVRRGPRETNELPLLLRLRAIFCRSTAECDNSVEMGITGIEKQDPGINGNIILMSVVSDLAQLDWPYVAGQVEKLCDVNRFDKSTSEIPCTYCRLSPGSSFGLPKASDEGLCEQEFRKRSLEAALGRRSNLRSIRLTASDKDLGFPSKAEVRLISRSQRAQSTKEWATDLLRVASSLDVGRQPCNYF